MGVFALRVTHSGDLDGLFDIENGNLDPLLSCFALPICIGILRAGYDCIVGLSFVHCALFVCLILG